MNGAADSGSIAGVLFDVDGTLVDSNDAHARAWVDACNESGIGGITFEKIRPLIGMGSDKVISKLDFGFAADSDAAKSLLAKRKAIFLDRYLNSVQPMPGARDVVEACKTRGLTCIVASASSPEELDPLLAIAGVAALFDHVIEADEVEASKPNPDIVHAGLRWVQLAPQRAVMVGDTRFDITAAHDAKVRCIALRCGGSPDSDLVEADAVFDSPLALAAAVGTVSLDELIAKRSG